MTTHKVKLKMQFGLFSFIFYETFRPRADTNYK